MGYRGEDASRTSAAWGEQPPRWPAAGAGTGGTGSWDDGSGSQWHDDHAADRGYDEYPRHDEYAGYGQQGHDDYGPGPREPYGAPVGYPDGYQRGNGYGGTGGFDHDDGYGYEQGGGYPAGSGYDQAAGYGQAAERGSQPRHAAGYRPGGGGGPGGYLALPSGRADSGGFAQSGGYSGNDWYDGQPDAASGSGFADTGTYTLNSRIIDEYGTGPAQALGNPVRGFPPVPSPVLAQPSAAQGPGPQALPYTGAQERYDDYDRYPGYGEDDPAEPQGYGTERGYPQSDDQDGWPGYGEQDGFAGHGYDDYADGGQDDYGPAAPDGGLGDYDDYAGYTDQYDRTGPQPDDLGSRPGGRAGRPGRGGKRGKRPLLLTAFAVVAAGVVIAAFYKLVLSPSGSTAAAQAQQPLPTSGPSASTPACVAQFGTYCHIELRSNDPTPLTVNELFPPAFQNVRDHASFRLAATKLDKTCSDAVIGQDLISALDKGKCTQVVRASYLSGDGKIMGTIGVVNLATTNQAHYAGKLVGQNDFIAPLAASKGTASKLGQGTGVVEAEFKGHYLILTWAEFTDGTKPTKTAQEQQLEQWEVDLVAGTANISLSERMVNGAPASPAAA